MEKDKENCSTSGGWGTTNANPSQKSRSPIWPGVYVWLLVGVIFIVSKLFF